MSRGGQEGRSRGGRHDIKFSQHFQGYASASTKMSMENVDLNRIIGQMCLLQKKVHHVGLMMMVFFF